MADAAPVVGLEGDEVVAAVEERVVFEQEATRWDGRAGTAKLPCAEGLPEPFA